MWELDYKESWVPKNWCFWTVVLEKTLRSPLDCKEIQPVHPKGERSWVFIERTDVEAEAPILWPHDVKSWPICKAPDAGKDWRQEEKGTTEDQMVGWHHWLNGHGFGWTQGVGDEQGGLVYCSSWGHKESDTTEWLNWTELGWSQLFDQGASIFEFHGCSYHLQWFCSTQNRSPTLQTDSLPAEPQGKPKNNGVGNLSILQWIFPTQELNQGLLQCGQILYQLSYEGSPVKWLDEA